MNVKQTCKTGFGFLRYPKLDERDDKSVNYPLLNAMVDKFLALGGDYFDTAYTYQNGMNEEALRCSLVERHPRHSFRIADKLPGYMTTSHENCWDYLEESLRRCGVEYFDVYLLHGLNAENYEIAQKQDQFGFLEEVRACGKARKTGFSYHDSPELLERILSEHPEVDYVQLQINYLDWDSCTIQARRCYDTAVRHNKRIIVMEPVKGGSLAKLPAEAEQMLIQMKPEESIVSWAIRFAGSLDHVELVLSGMNSMEQMMDNMRPLIKLTGQEVSVLTQTADVIRSAIAVPCTGCGYCTDGCPSNIPIPTLFALYNEYARSPGENWKMQYAYNDSIHNRGSALDCIECGQCQQRCPQKIGIIDWMPKIAKAFSD